VPLKHITPRTLRDYCDGCVIDRATAPPDLVDDLERLPEAAYYDSSKPAPRRNMRPPEWDHDDPSSAMPKRPRLEMI
jgi:hypothetical protein